MAKRRAKSIPLPDDVREFFRQQGAKGGAIGGKRRFAAMTDEERRELGKKAALARWSKTKRKGK